MRTLTGCCSTTAPIRGRAGWWPRTKVPTSTRRRTSSRPTSAPTRAGPPRKRRRCTWSKRTTTTSAPSNRWLLSGVLAQEFQCALVELLGVLIDGGVRAVVKDDELAVCDPFGERGREPRGGDQVMPPEGDQRRRLDRAERRPCVVGQY